MKEVIKDSGNLDPKSLYLLTEAPNTERMDSMAGESMHIDAWAYGVTESEATEDKPLLCIKSGDKVFATISETFINTFLSMVDFFAARSMRVTDIKVLQGTSRAGRKYINCQFVEAIETE